MFIFDTHMHFDLYQDQDKWKMLGQIEHKKSFTIAVTNLPVLFKNYQCQFDWTKFKYIRLALGFHPELVKQYYKQLDNFVELLPQTRYVGEVGLDYVGKNSKIKETQLEVFTNIVTECSKYKNKILTIHSRGAEQDILRTMKSFSGRVIFHWYSGSIKNLYEAVERGYYFSINQQMLLSNNGRMIIDAIPIDNLLLESDAPFTKGLEDKYNYSFINKLYAYLGEVKRMDVDELSCALKSNFRLMLSFHNKI